MSRVVPVRVSSSERDIIRKAAHKRRISNIVEAAREIAAKLTRTFASLEIDTEYRVTLKASPATKAEERIAERQRTSLC